jgi:hypothetical protein
MRYRASSVLQVFVTFGTYIAYGHERLHAFTDWTDWTYRIDVNTQQRRLLGFTRDMFFGGMFPRTYARFLLSIRTGICGFGYMSPYETLFYRACVFHMYFQITWRRKNCFIPDHDFARGRCYRRQGCQIMYMEVTCQSIVYGGKTRLISTHDEATSV